jgi:DNA mismatch endonuclease (patch repair protein)
VLPKYRAVVFVHGCFWHGHSCKRSKQPGTNVRFWRTKIRANRIRDGNNKRQLRRLGWRVFTIWECSLRRDGESTVRRLENRIR